MSNPQEPSPFGPDTGHDYDGIRELDNHLPNWWLATLFITVVFGFGYYFYYHNLTSSPHQLDEYRAELEEASAAALVRAKAKGGVSDDALVAMSGIAAQTSAGEATYKQFCIACHGDKGQGIVGPNLTDTYWIHGPKPTDMLKTVQEGVLAKGMPAWGPVLGADKTESVVAFVLTLRGKNVPGKEPQGEKAP